MHGKTNVPRPGQERGGGQHADRVNFWVLGCMFHFCLTTDFSGFLQQFSVSSRVSLLMLASVVPYAALRCHKPSRKPADTLPVLMGTQHRWVMLRLLQDLC